MSKLEIYSSVFIFLNKNKFSADKFYDFLQKKLLTCNRETLIIASIDAIIVNQNMELYNLLVNEFMVNPSSFSLRLNSSRYEGSEKAKLFFRQIKLEKLLK